MISVDRIVPLRTWYVRSAVIMSGVAVASVVLMLANAWLEGARIVISLNDESCSTKPGLVDRIAGVRSARHPVMDWVSGKCSMFHEASKIQRQS